MSFPPVNLYYYIANTFLALIKKKNTKDIISYNISYNISFYDIFLWNLSFHCTIRTPKKSAKESKYAKQIQKENEEKN